MNFRNDLVKKYFVKQYDSESELYESSMKYRIECSENDIPDDENIIRFLNKFEYKHIIELIKKAKQTKKYKTWFSKVFNNDFYDCFDKNKKLVDRYKNE